jgi:hypothetical protein
MITFEQHHYVMQTVATFAFEVKTQLFSAFCKILTCNGNMSGRQVPPITVHAYICHYILQSSFNVNATFFWHSIPYPHTRNNPQLLPDIREKHTITQ